MLIEKLEPNDYFSLVLFNTEAQCVIPLIKVSEIDKELFD
jgi:hypothetical protein